MNKINIGKAIAKIILIGEHSVVYGKPAIAIPFSDAKIYTKIEKIDGEIQIESNIFSGLLKDVPEVIHPIRDIILRVLNEFKVDPKGIKFVVWGNIPYERGMGSSAALAASVVRSLYKYFDHELDCQTTLKLVNLSEDRIHGSSSGVDANVIVKQKPVYYIKGQLFEEIDMNLDAYLLIADTGHKGRTKEAVSDVRTLVESNIVYSKYIDELGELAIQARDCIQNNIPILLGKLMTKAQEYLSRLTVSNAMLDMLIEEALLQGALGAKLTGGGRGGCMISLFDGLDSAKQAADKLMERGAVNTWITYLGAKNAKG